MKIDIKQLAGYIPYDLKCAYLSVSGEYKTYTMGTDNFVGVLISDLDKPILKSMKFIDPKVLRDFNFIKHPYKCDNVDLFSYEFVKYCFNNHYDIFKLIDKGLAYDASDITK